MTTTPTFRNLLLLITAMAISMSACQKATDGAVGPQGATGAVGPQGTPGAGGPTGPKGDPGTANVTYSPWADVTFTGSGTLYTASVTAPGITQAVLNTAAIHVYWRVTSGYYVQLPYSEVVSTTTYTLLHRLFVGRIDLRASYALSTGQKIRYVIIPGGVAGGRKAAVDMNDYAAVKAYYHIPD